MKDDYADHWNVKFSEREWGRYPPEELVKFMGRQFKNADHSVIKVLEMGTGPGANLWFLHREGYDVYGIDISEVAIKKSFERLANENKDINKRKPDLRVGNFSSLPWDNDYFDVVIDIFSIYANKRIVIDQAISEVFRVLKSGGIFFTKVWGVDSSGLDSGVEIEENTFDDMSSGPCAGMGLSHFFNTEELRDVFSDFHCVELENIIRKFSQNDDVVQEFVGVYRKGSM